jgi:hypothetical protein
MNLESCVYYFFTEDIRFKKQKIHKIVKMNDYILNKLTNQHKLLKINNRKNHFYLCENTKELNITAINETDTKIQQKYYKNDNTLLLEYENCQLIELKIYLKELTSSKIYLLTIINFYKHLLNSIQILINNHIFYNYINFSSIVVSSKDFPLLSNFSFSVDLIKNNIEMYVIEYEPSYIGLPIELHILSYMQTNNLKSLSLFNIETIFDDFMKTHNILNTFNKNVVSSFKKEGLQYFNKYINKPYNYILNDIMKYSSTWDNYALSILFLRIIIGIHKTIKITNKFIILFMKLLVNNIHLDPVQRYSVNTTIQQFNNILDNIDPKEYKDIIHNLMSA